MYLTLTATATKGTLKMIQERPSLRDPKVIGLPPTQPNIVYKVQQLLKHDEFCEILSHDLLQCGKAIQRLIFCHSYPNCAELLQISKAKNG